MPLATSPHGPVGKVRSPLLVLIFSLITLGIYYLYWQYQIFREMKEYAGQGVGPVIGLLLAIFIAIVNAFLIPAEIGNLYAGQGLEKPITGLSGFWTFIPLVGGIIWIFKVQGRLNERWSAA